MRHTHAQCTLEINELALRLLACTVVVCTNVCTCTAALEFSTRLEVQQQQRRGMQSAKECGGAGLLDWANSSTAAAEGGLPTQQVSMKELVDEALAGLQLYATSDDES